jgi:DnaJ-class molecular chaperone
MMKRWTKILCHGCDGHGLISAYTIDGSDFLGADECKTCNGSGQLFQSSKGVLVQWPGGPFMGRASALDDVIAGKQRRKWS